MDRSVVRVAWTVWSQVRMDYLVTVVVVLEAFHPEPTTLQGRVDYSVTRAAWTGSSRLFGRRPRVDCLVIYSYA